MEFSMKNTMMVCKIQHEDYAGEGREEEEGRKEGRGKKRERLKGRVFERVLVIYFNCNG